MPLFVIFALNCYDYCYFLLAVAGTFVGFGEKGKKSEKKGLCWIWFCVPILAKNDEVVRYLINGKILQ